MILKTIITIYWLGGPAIAVYASDARVMEHWGYLRTCPRQQQPKGLQRLLSLKLTNAQDLFDRATLLMEARVDGEDARLCAIQALRDCEEGIQLPGGKAHEDLLLVAKMYCAWYRYHDGKLVDKQAQILLSKYPTLQSYRYAFRTHCLSGNIAAARNEIDKACSLSSSSLFERAIFRAGHQEYEKALQDFDAILRSEPTNYAARRDRATMYYLLGRYADVNNELAILNRQGRNRIYTLGGIKINASYFEPPHNAVSPLFTTAAGRLDFQETITEFERRLKSKMTLSTADKLELGQLYFLDGQNQNAISTFTSIIAEDPGNPWAYYYRAATYHALDNRDKWRNDLQKAIELYGRVKSHQDKQEPETWNNQTIRF